MPEAGADPYTVHSDCTGTGDHRRRHGQKHLGDDPFHHHRRHESPYHPACLLASAYLRVCFCHGGSHVCEVTHSDSSTGRSRFR